MEIILIETEAFHALIETVLKRIHSGKINQVNSNLAKDDNEWLSIQEAQLLLPYRSKTKWQKLRDTGKIDFSKIGRKILYNKTSIVNYIKSNKVKF